MSAALALCALALTATSAEPLGISLAGSAAGGGHLRIVTEHGPVHVWRPPGYRRQGAGMLIYLHGYFTHVDQAWEEHRLAEQFRKSRQNALFIVPEAPAGKGEEVSWQDLGQLLEALERWGNLRRPDGPLVVLAHSGAYRTVAPWLSFRRLDEVILLDALYAHDDDFLAWVQSAPGHQANKLVLVAVSTEKRSAALAERAPFASRQPRLPARMLALPRGERGARVVYFKSQYDHMGLVTSGEVIAELLALTPFARIE